MGDYDREHPPFWPKLEPTPNSVSLNDLWATTDASINLLAVVVEHEPYYNGFATMINYVDNKQVRVVVVPPTHPIATMFGGVVVPALHAFKREQPNVAAYSSSIEAKFQDIKKELDALISASSPPPPPVAKPMPMVAQAAPVGSEPAVPVDWKQYEVQYLDLISALYYMATQEIPRRQVIDGSHLSALKGWVHVLKRFVPLSAPVRRLFYRLDEWVQKEPTQIRAEQWLSKFEEIQGELGHPIPANTTWQACRGSKPFLRGYTCGLWTLFHAITVEAYKENKLDPRFRPLDEVLEPIHQFILHYLSCEICRQNFDKMTMNNRLSDVSKPEDVILWLWRAHNNVNQRLSGEASEDPKFPKRQFPPASVCPECQSNGAYHEEKIVNFMLRYYSDVKVDNVRPQPEYRVHEFENGKLQKVVDKHLNPKFAAMSGKVDKLEEAEARLRDAGPKRSWQRISSDEYGT
ncbi:Protein F47B7.2 c [Aphelenchoides avenae]|nr:Protein F47B7.2 c [Aphelenchus avenae]